MALALAGAAQEPTPPGIWPRLDRTRDELAAWLANPASPPPTAEQVRAWRTLEHHSFWRHDTDGERAFMVTQWLPTLRLLAAADRRDTGYRLDLPWQLGFLVDLKGLGLFALAEQLAVELLLPASAGTPLHAQFALELAECRRRMFHFAAAAAALALVEAEVAAGRGEERVPCQLAVQRALLAVECGLPDEAFRHLAEARAAAAAMPEGPPGDTQRYAATFAALRLHHSLTRADLALRTWRELQDSGQAQRLAASDVGARRLAQLGIRVGMTVLEDPATTADQRALGRSLLRDALAVAGLANDEQIQARMALAADALEAGDLPGAESLLAAMAGQLDADVAGQHAINLAGLGLRAARRAGMRGAELDSRAAAARAAYDELLASWERRPDSPHGVGPLFLTRWRRLLVELLLDRPGRSPPATAAAAVDLLARTQALGSLARALHAPTPSAAEVQRVLCRPGRGLLLYVPGDVESVVVAVDQEHILLAPLAIGTVALDRRRSALLQAVQAARQEPATDLGTVDASARDLAGVLLPDPIRTVMAGWQAVAIVGIETLGYLPFELLPWQGQRLGTAKAVSYLPSLPVGVWLARNRPASPPVAEGRAWLGVATETPPPAGAAVSALPFTALERSRLLHGLADCRGELVAGATREVFQAAAAGHELVQLLVHGIRDELRADPQGLLLGDGTVLWSQDLDRHMPPYLLLTACRAGSGRLRRGDDGRHLLAGAALLGGSRAVVVPWLDIEYQTTVDLSAALHRGLWSEGRTLEAALQRARVAAATAHPGALDPFLLHLVGLGDAPLANAPPAANWLWRLAGVVLLLLAAAGVARRRRPAHVDR